MPRPERKRKIVAKIEMPDILTDYIIIEAAIADINAMKLGEFGRYKFEVVANDVLKVDLHVSALYDPKDVLAYILSFNEAVEPTRESEIVNE